MSWQFDEEGNATPTTKEDQRKICTQIRINDKANKSQTLIVQKEVSDAHKTLGCFKSIDGNEIKQVKFLKQRSDAIGSRVPSAKLSRKQATMSYKMVYIPSLKYGLPACSLTIEDIEQIQNYSVDKFISAMGYEHLIPREVAFGPADYGGIEIPHLFTEMMSSKLETIISHVRAGTKLGQAILININYLQLTTGIETPIFESREDIDYVDNNWLLHLRDYMIHINAVLELPQVWTIKKQRENDVVLMDAFKKRGLTKSELRLVNNWRMLYQVNTLVDICDPVGNKIEKDFLKRPKGKPVKKSHQSTLSWPIQKEPGKKGFAICCRCLRECFNVQSEGRINYKFGKWLTPNHHSQNACSAYYHPSTQFGFINNNSIKYYIPQISRSSSITFNKVISHASSEIPIDCIPAMLQDIKHNNCVLRYNNSTTEDINKYEQVDVDIIEKWKQPFIEYLEIVNEGLVKQIWQDESRPFVIVSDGGVSDHRGTYGVVLSDGINLFSTNKGKMYSVDYLESPFWSEMYALLAGILSFQSIIDTERNSTSSLTLYSDNKKLIERLCQRRTRRRTVNQYRGSDVDLELQILDEIRKLEQQHHTVILKVVKGHQDLVKLKSSLNHEETLNVWANQLAKEARKLSDQQDYIQLPTNYVNLKLNDDYINSKHTSVTKKAYHSIRFCKYLQKRHGWSHKTIESIWWKAYFKSFKLPTNQHEHRKYDHKPEICKQCKQDIVETEDHIIQCLCAPRKKLRAEWLSEVKEFLSNKHTPENVRDAIYYVLDNLLNKLS